MCFHFSTYLECSDDGKVETWILSDEYKQEDIRKLYFTILDIRGKLSFLVFITFFTSLIIFFKNVLSHMDTHLHFLFIINEIQNTGLMQIRFLRQIFANI